MFNVHLNYNYLFMGQAFETERNQPAKKSMNSKTEQEK